MSRIGIKPLKVPASVEVNINDGILTAKGSLGTLSVNVPSFILINRKNDVLSVTRANDTKEAKSMHGTVRKLVENAVVGVDKGFEKKLELVGIGYRANLEGNTLVLQVGFTHPVKFEIPENIKIKVEKNVITISGADKHFIGQFAANVRMVRKPEPYKGKGIRYQGEHVRMKAGKSAKTG